MFAPGLALVVIATALSPPADRAALVRARELYNREQYEAAIVAAMEARTDPVWADSAALVLARAHLEKFRRTADPQDLAAARDLLRAVRPAGLSPRDRAELVIGLAESLYLDDAYGAAAELFDSALTRAELVGPRARERVLDWWASALEREAQNRPVGERDQLFQRMLARMEEELRRDPGSAAAAYWLAAAARGLGDLERAWEVAIAGWVRAPLTFDRGAALRADLDRLVLQGVIPERVRQLPGPARDHEQAAAGMRAEWELIKERWK